MLWEAGQERVQRESRDRLTELYVGVRDGQLAALLASGQAKSRGDPRPSYVRRDDVARGDAAAQRATLSRLAALFPKNVRVT